MIATDTDPKSRKAIVLDIIEISFNLFTSEIRHVHRLGPIDVICYLAGHSRLTHQCDNAKDTFYTTYSIEPIMCSRNE